MPQILEHLFNEKEMKSTYLCVFYQLKSITSDKYDILRDQLKSIN
jgi:hypothetical protein